MTRLWRLDPAPPIRMIHLGVGNFFRAHQAWYTAHAGDAGEWGYAAFTGRSAEVAEQLAPADGLYTLITQGADGNEYDVIGVLSAVHPGDQVDILREYFIRPEVVVVTSTVTEAGYYRDATGGLDLTRPEVAADIAALQAAPLAASATTTPGRMVAGLLARRAFAPRAGITFVPCDNVPENGTMVGRVLRDLAARVDPTLVGWIDEHVSFVTTMVDRITPRTTDADRAAVLEDTGFEDPAAVVTEPFTEWVLQGTFAAGHPDWAAAGATFVDDLDPFERRKLWMLNGSHSLMAYAATILGHETVLDAINDPQVRGWVDQWWEAAARHLDLPETEVDAYRDALVERYENPQIRHLLAQIAADGSQKLPIRIVPVLAAELAAGRQAEGPLRAVAAWTLHLRGLGAPINDVGGDQVLRLANGSLDESLESVLQWLGIDNQGAVATARLLAIELQAAGTGRS